MHLNNVFPAIRLCILIAQYFQSYLPFHYSNYSLLQDISLNTNLTMSQAQSEQDQVARRLKFSQAHIRPGSDNIDASSDRHWYSIWSFGKGITLRYMKSAHPIGVFEVDLHDLWHKLIAVAKVTPADDAESDRIVAQVMRLRELGTLVRKETGQRAVVSNGQRMWTDLPFLAQDLRTEWAESLHLMTPEKRDNFAGFTSRLLESGIGGDGIAACALILLRETLETPQTSLSIDEALFANFMSAVFTWLYWGSFKIWKLSVLEPSAQDPELTATDMHWGDVGELAAAAGVKQKGFSEQRLRFWISRLESIAGELADKNGVLSDKCKRSANMLSQWDETMNQGQP